MWRTLSLLFALTPVLWPAASRNLDIYYIDVEGGAATLLVTPGGQSLLADTGWRGFEDRDPKRIYEVATRQAGLKKIDYVLITHFHADHVGGLEGLAKLLPIDHFLDHGDSVESAPRAAELWKTYESLAAGKRLTLHPGERLPLQGVEALVVSSNGDVLPGPLKGGGQANEVRCRDAQLKEDRPTEDPRSLGFLLTFGKFRFLDIGDLTWNKEHALACPQNRLGRVDLYQVTCHGANQSGAPEHVLALEPRVAIMNNGARKGGNKETFETLRKSPGLQDLWQVHRSLEAGDLNSDERLIANPEAECQGHWLKVSVASNGKYTVTNSRNNFSKTYTAR
jgi:competence protein ComEC